MRYFLVFGALLLATARVDAAGPHPEPRVIVRVLSVAGPHDRDRVERAAREAWGKIIRCYKSLARGERGDVKLELTIAARGRVTRARQTRSTLSNEELSACLTDAMDGLSMPKASARSVARVSVWVAPGDSTTRVTR